MLVIRQEQMDVFAPVALKSFERRMVAHLTGRFPEECRAMGEPKLRELIQKGVRDAAAYGIQREYDVARFTEMMVTFGEEFHKDPAQAWAVRILRDRKLSSKEKMNKVCEEAAKNRPGPSTGKR